MPIHWKAIQDLYFLFSLQHLTSFTGWRIVDKETKMSNRNWLRTQANAECNIGSWSWLFCLRCVLFKTNTCKALSKLDMFCDQTRSNIVWWPRGVGVSGPLFKTLILFMTKICDFRHPIYNLTKIRYPIYYLTLKSIPCLRPALQLEPYLKLMLNIIYDEIFFLMVFLIMMKKKLPFKTPISRLESKSHTLFMTKTAETLPFIAAHTCIDHISENLLPPLVKNVLMLYCVAKRYQKCLNEQNVVFDQMFEVVHILSNTIQHDQTWSWNGKNV